MEEINTQRIEFIRKSWRETASGPSEKWRLECELIPKYMPPYPTKDTRPKFVIKAKNTKLYLRYSCGPGQGHFWDVYGDDYINEELATHAIGQAPRPQGRSEVPFLLHQIEVLTNRLDEVETKHKRCVD